MRPPPLPLQGDPFFVEGVDLASAKNIYQHSSNSAGHRTRRHQHTFNANLQTRYFVFKPISCQAYILALAKYRANGADYRYLFDPIQAIVPVARRNVSLSYGIGVCKLTPPMARTENGACILESHEQAFLFLLIV